MRMRKPSYCWAFFWSKNGLDENIMGDSACGFLGFPYPAMAAVARGSAGGRTRGMVRCNVADWGRRFVRTYTDTLCAELIF